MKILKKYPEALFLLKVLLLYCIFNYGSQAWIGITAKGGFYSQFADDYLNYIVWLRYSILKGADIVCSIFGYDVIIIGTKIIRFNQGFGVSMVYSCIGIAIFSSWAAFIIAYPSELKRKLKWLFSGLLAIWFINVLRISILLFILNLTKKSNNFEFHHEVFNAVAYGLVIILIYFYLKGDKKKV